MRSFFFIFEGLLHQFKYRSIVILIAANFTTLYGVYYLGWNINQLVILYWVENVIIGLYNVLKMAYNTNENLNDIKMNGKQLQKGELHAAKVFMIPFFIMHYGMFTFVHGVFIFVYFMFGISNGDSFSWSDAGYLLFNIIMIFVSHGISFATNYIGNDERSKITIGTLMFTPYIRIFAMQLVVIFGGMVYMNTGRHDVSLYILIIFKIIADVFAHVLERKKAQKIH